MSKSRIVQIVLDFPGKLGWDAYVLDLGEKEGRGRTVLVLDEEFKGRKEIGRYKGSDEIYNATIGSGGEVKLV